MLERVATYKFGPYEVHTRTRELYNQGIKLKLRKQAFQVLHVLVEHAGDVVTREELRQMLWPAGTFVDFEHGLNSSVKELRRALRDSANDPRYIETLPRLGYRFIAETSPSTENHRRLVPSHPQMIGRHHTISDILDVWSAGERGVRQVLFLSGEPGIGKTTIVQQVLARATAAGTAKATWGQCTQHYGIGEPYQPLLEAIMRLCSQPGGAGLVPVLERYAPTWLAQLPALLPPERHATLRRTVAGTTRQRMLRELTDALEAATTQIPLVLCLEDLHWSDASTLDWIAAFAQRPEPTRILLIGTFRTKTVASAGHPLSRVVDELHIKRCCREITLRGMSESDVADFIALRLPPAAGRAQDLRRLALRVHRHTGGNPLFVVNVLDDLVARSLIFEQDGRWALNSNLNEINLGTPDDVRRIIAGQLERLPPTECTLLEVASVAGSTFSATTVAGAAGLTADDVEATLTGLARQQRFVRHSGDGLSSITFCTATCCTNGSPAAVEPLCIGRSPKERKRATANARARSRPNWRCTSNGVATSGGPGCIYSRRPRMRGAVVLFRKHERTSKGRWRFSKTNQPAASGPSVKSICGSAWELPPWRCGDGVHRRPKQRIHGHGSCVPNSARAPCCSRRFGGFGCSIGDEDH